VEMAVMETTLIAKGIQDFTNVKFLWKSTTTMTLMRMTIPPMALTLNIILPMGLSTVMNFNMTTQT
jgi:hypothetical protein